MKVILPGISLILCLCFTYSGNAQIQAPKFGKGINITALDSSFYMKVGFRFQTLFTNDWNLANDELSGAEDYESAILIRRSRLKFNGWIFSEKLKYKSELALSNRDNGGGNSSFFSNAANVILDASIEWNFYENFSIWVGQGKWPGNRERIISSGNMQFVDRSRLNSRFTLDRDVGIMLKHHDKFGDKFILRETIALGSGEGKNITSGNIGGHAYTFKLEALPFGSFKSKGDYVGSAIVREKTPKLAVAVAYDINNDAGRERGQKGSFIVDPEGDFAGKTINTLSADLMFKYQGLSIMAEYAQRSTADGDPHVYYGDESEVIGTYYTGTGFNFSLGYMFKNNWEIAGRWTDIKPDKEVANEETQYTLGLSKFIVGHKLKVQSDITYRAIDASDDDLFFRMQVDLHF